MGWFKWLFILLLVFVGFLLATAPARIVPLVLKQFAPDVQLQHATGTLWDGKAATAVVSLAGGAINLGAVSWRLDPLSVLSLTPSLHIDTDAGTHKLSADVSVLLLKRELQAEAVTGHFPIALLEPWVPMLVRGTIELDIALLRADQKSLLDASGTLYVQQLDWMAGPRPMPLGSYTADISVESGSLQVKLLDRQAQLGIDGMLAISPDGTYSLDALLSTTGTLAPEVSQAVVFFGSKTPDGRIRVNNKGRWR